MSHIEGSPMDWAVTNLWDKLVTGQERDARSIGAMAVFEQAAYKSAKGKRCIRCGDPCSTKVGPGTYLQSTHYFMCADCAGR